MEYSSNKIRGGSHFISGIYKNMQDRTKGGVGGQVPDKNGQSILCIQDWLAVLKRHKTVFVQLKKLD